jgi:protein arginine kinase
MTRIRLARNLAGHRFPGWAADGQRAAILKTCRAALAATAPLTRAAQASIDELSELDRQILVERHLISRELSDAKNGAGVVISPDQTISVMINEEDHLRLQVLRAGFQLKKAWAAIDALDTALEDCLDYAFSPTLGYLTACPTNLGTGLRASAMMHLPALVISGQMEKVVRAVNQLGLAVRGLFGEGSDASGSIFQISNQTTLGESEDTIIKRLGSVLHSIIEHELNARARLVEKDAARLHDKIGRAYGILQHSHLLTSGEAMNLLSLVRLGADLGYFPENSRSLVDRLFIEAQPGHIQHHATKTDLDPAQRDTRRAGHLRTEFAAFPAPNFLNSADAKTQNDN